jgi:hypothetical protein
MQAETDKAIAGVLKEDQLKRIKQIELQVGGLRALGKEDVQKELKLTDKQKEDLKSINEEVSKDTREIMMDVGRDREKRAEAQKKVAELSKKALDKFTEKFTDDQKKLFKEMTGEKFDYKPTRPGPGTGTERPNRRPRTDA